MNDIIHIRIRQASIARKNRRSKRIRRLFNIQRNSKCRNISKIKSSSNTNRLYQAHVTEVEVKLCEDFRLLFNTESVIKCVHEVIEYVNKRGRYKVFINMSVMQMADSGAISLLLAAVNLSTRNNCQVTGNMPINTECKQLIFDYGFFDHVKLLQTKKIKKNNNKNLLIERGFAKTDNEKIGEEVRKSVEYLTSMKSSYRPVYSMIQEICANSIEHANKESHKKNWLFSISYEENLVKFVVTDIGEGILGTIKKKLKQTLRDTVTFTNDIETLIGVFEKRYQSSTFDNNRNKGLPKIKKINDYGYIDNLIVLTNNVYLNFNDSSKQLKLRTSFSGTLFYWELQINNIEKWKNRMK